MYEELIQTPEKWPIRPFLCMKRGGGRDDFPFQSGVMVEDKLKTVFITNIFAARTYANVVSSPSITYPSLDALLEDGWRVD